MCVRAKRKFKSLPQIVDKKAPLKNKTLRFFFRRFLNIRESSFDLQAVQKFK